MMSIEYVILINQNILPKTTFTRFYNTFIIIIIFILHNFYFHSSLTMPHQCFLHLPCQEKRISVDVQHFNKYLKSWL